MVISLYASSAEFTFISFKPVIKQPMLYTLLQRLNHVRGQFQNTVSLENLASDGQKIDTSTEFLPTTVVIGPVSMSECLPLKSFSTLFLSYTVNLF